MAGNMLTYRVDDDDSIRFLGGFTFAPSLLVVALVHHEEEVGWSVSLDARTFGGAGLQTAFYRSRLAVSPFLISDGCSLAFSSDLQDIYLNLNVTSEVLVVPLVQDAVVRTWDVGLCVFDLFVGGAGTPSEGMVIASSLDGKMVVWDVASSRPLFRDNPGSRAEPESIFGCAALSPDGRTFALNSDEGRLYVWDLDRLREGNVPRCRVFSDSTNSINWSLDSSTIIGSNTLNRDVLILRNTATGVRTLSSLAPLKVGECVAINDAGGAPAYAVTADDDLYILVSGTQRLLVKGRKRHQMCSLAYSRERHILFWLDLFNGKSQVKMIWL